VAAVAGAGQAAGAALDSMTGAEAVTTPDSMTAAGAVAEAGVVAGQAGEAEASIMISMMTYSAGIISSTTDLTTTGFSATEAQEEAVTGVSIMILTIISSAGGITGLTIVSSDMAAAFTTLVLMTGAV